MTELLDHIFSTLDIESLKREQVNQHLRYLQEIYPQLQTNDDMIKYLGYQVRLTRRLLVIDHNSNYALQMALEKKHQVVKLKKAKHYLRG